MNGLTLRISKGGGRSRKNAAGFKPLDITSFVGKSLLEKNILFRNFGQSSSADMQLVILKKILDDATLTCKDETIRFLVIVFLHADPKHPVKCFLTRHVTKNSIIQHPFANTLAIYIISTITQNHKDYTKYMDVVSTLPACVENFPTGASAVKFVEVELAGYLKTCLECCVGTLRDTEISNTLSPTEKNKLFNLAHLALRLLLYIVQKISDKNISSLTSIFKEIRVSMNYLLFDEDVPMDTKSVCGILYLCMYILENGSDTWVNILRPQQSDDELKQLLSNEASQLAVCSAIATVVSMERLQLETIDQQSAVTALTLKIVSIGERSSSESTFTLGVTRTLLQISKGLNRIADKAVGLELVDCLLVFIWAHLEHYMDSVRHLTAQMLGCVVKYCTNLRRDGDDSALDNLFAALAHLDKTRKSYYVSVTSLAVELGAAAIMEKLPDVVCDVISALNMQAVQASATTTLETLLQKHIRESNTECIYRAWIEPILSHVATNVLECGALNILENLLSTAIKLDDHIMDFILPYIEQSCDPHAQTQDLKCILMLLSVARKSGVLGRPAAERRGHWRGVVSYELLRIAAVDAVEETRILSLSLVVESPKSTELFTPAELQFVLHYFKYNANAQSPNFRQLTLSMMKKFMKRLEDSHKVLRRQKDLHEDYYVAFLEDLRAQCFSSLILGANYSRRFVALQVLVWCERAQFEGCDRIWKEEYVEKLLLHLEDSYETNKAFALEILDKCPVDLIEGKNYTIKLAIEDILRQASSLKPTDCISAAYKLNLLRNKLPHYILQGETSTAAEAATYSLLRRLQAALREELAICARSVVAGAGRGPMYGLLHCMGHLLTRVDARAISGDQQWTELVSEVVRTCMAVDAAVAGVVSSSSPEGHLPMDMDTTGLAVTDYGNSGGVTLDDGRQVTSQMVLLCAWRSVKEVSLLLGEISSRLTIADEECPRGTLAAAQLLAMGEHFTGLLAETKHRGAFEQAYVGFTKLLARLWRCRSPALHELPRAWLTELVAAIASGDKKGVLCATRRSAGLPFMIQALVTTELQVLGNPKCFHQCMATLLHLARSPAPTESAIERRTHSINILRALFRNAALDESVAGHVGAGLIVALQGFEGGTWMERNSSTLLFSALMVRIFGVQRSRDADRLSVRNRMTGRVFFLRYPRLYDYMLEKLEEVSSSEDTQLLRPSLYPILLLLARLYPSSLEGTVSNLKLVAYIPHVLSCAKSSVLKTRQLAAKAMVPLISPEQYVTHLETILNLICDKDIKRNYCHGLLLQLTRFLDAKPEALVMEAEATERLQKHIRDTLWILEQVLEDKPCYLLLDEYVKVCNLIVWRFPCLVNKEFVSKIEIYLEQLLFNIKEVPRIVFGRDICLANAIYFYFIILNKFSETENVCELIYKSLTHTSYEVILSALNYILILYGNLEIENKFQEFLLEISNAEVLKKLRDSQKYIQSLCIVLENNKYLECKQKTLKVLTLEENTEKYVIQMETKTTDEMIIKSLFDYISNEHENLVHIYLGSLSNFITKKLKANSIKASTVLEVIKTIFACSSSDNNEETRTVIAEFLQRNSEELFMLNLDGLNEEDKFEYKATLYATTVRLLEDDSPTLRQRISNTISKLLRASSRRVISSKAAEELRGWIAVGQSEVLVVLALLDFKSEVYVTDEVNDECRVFDHNERHNIFLEETAWTVDCADRIIQACNKTNTKPVHFVQDIIDNPLYRRTFEKLCYNNFSLFEDIVKKRKISTNLINPKVELFIKKLCM